MSNVDSEPSALGSQTDDETETAKVIGEGQEASVVDVLEERRSERVRKATTRFEEGWYGEKLPRLSSALGVRK